MARECSICNHKDRSLIDADLLSGSSNRTIATQYGVSISAVQRHRKHIPATLAKAQEAQEITRSDDLLEQTRDLLNLAQSITDEARKAGDLRTAVSGIGQIKNILELLMKVNLEMARMAEAKGSGESRGPIQFVQMAVQQRDD